MLVPRAGAQAVGWEAQSRESTAGPTRLPLTATSSFGTGRCAELQVHVTEVMATAAEQRDLIDHGIWLGLSTENQNDSIQKC